MIPGGKDAGSTSELIFRKARDYRSRSIPCTCRSPTQFFFLMGDVPVFHTLHYKASEIRLPGLRIIKKLLEHCYRE